MIGAGKAAWKVIIVKEKNAVDIQNIQCTGLRKRTISVKNSATMVEFRCMDSEQMLREVNYEEV